MAIGGDGGGDGGAGGEDSRGGSLKARRNKLKRRRNEAIVFAMIFVDVILHIQ